jgi:hypothetical protein
LLATAVADGRDGDGVWCPIDALGGQALPTLTKKAVRHALDAGLGPLFRGHRD